MIWDIIVWTAGVLNIALVIYHGRLVRKYRKLNFLLTDIVIGAFVMQHAPIWLAWTELSGRRFRIEIEPVQAWREMP